ncbi:hypothetical protein BKA61DRAFT_582322 [Leptodontidium sp. MPI-SDFR-AT-0119]|nr:hypothetical protein BKA61DRAFT_582322 [Leptodontidium sp. MPI-SDFR-AT-0119]
MAFTLNITPETYIREYLDPQFIISTKSLAYNINGFKAKGFNLKTKNFKQIFGYLIRLQSNEIYFNIYREIRDLISKENLNNFLIIIEYQIGSAIESVITAGINKETQENIYTNRPYKPEILQVFTEVITKEGYKLPSWSSKKRKANSSFSPREASTFLKELNEQINYLIHEFNSQFAEPNAASISSLEEVELISDDDFEVS